MKRKKIPEATRAIVRVLQRIVDKNGPVLHGDFRLEHHDKDSDTLAAIKVLCDEIDDLRERVAALEARGE